MQYFESHIDRAVQVAKPVASVGGILLLCWFAGCGTSANPLNQTGTATAGPQTYFAPYIQGGSDSVPQTFTFDDVKKSFAQTTYESGPQVLNAGSFTADQRGLRSLSITNPANATQTGNFAVELAGQAGGLVQLAGQPAQPLVAATQCPSFSSTQNYQFITIPGQVFDPINDIAYGSVGIVSSGSAVTFQNIHQYALTSAAAAQPSASTTVTGACGPTFFGSITNFPGQLVVTDPGAVNSPPPPAQAQIGIGPTGLLVEYNGYPNVMAGTSPPIDYENVLGAGSGAVGLPTPSGSLDTGTLVGAQYLGFIYSGGEIGPFGNQITPWSSHLASFGFPGSLPSGCLSVTGSTSNLIYGGDFPQANGQDNPSASPGGFGNYDLAIDLGTQSSNGLYPNATVWVGSCYSGNTTGQTYHFSAVAIAGQLNIAGQTNGKYAVFVIGHDSTQPWAIYLLQSN